MTQLDACFCLLRPNEFGLGGDDESSNVPPLEETEQGECEDEEGARAHGFTTPALSIEVMFSPSSELEELQETSDNEAVLDNLRDLYAVLVNKLIPLSKKWSLTLMKAGREVAGDDMLKKSIDLKVYVKYFFIFL